MNEILRLVPVFKDYIWGGDRLKADFGSTLDKVAEAWVCACHKDGKSKVVGGKFSGRILEEVIGLSSDEYSNTEVFPLLIKLIDAKQFLSVQVHPDDDYSQKNEGQPGKTELWYIIDAEEGAGIYYGFKEKITREQFEQHIKKGTLTDVLNFVEVKPGDSFFIEAGTIHAIGAGLLIAEIQQNSNVTYRVYDYGRVDADGKPRELHIGQALDVTKTEPAQSRPVSSRTKAGDGELTLLADCKHFKTQKLTLNGKAAIALPDRHTVLLAVSGSGTISGAGSFGKNDCFYVPDSINEIHISGRCELLIASDNVASSD